MAPSSRFQSAPRTSFNSPSASTSGSQARRSRGFPKVFIPTVSCFTAKFRGPPFRESVCRLRRFVRMQDQLLHTPIHDFGDIEFVFRWAGDFVNPAELFGLSAGTAEDAENL